METLHVSHQASEKAAVRNSGLVKLVVLVKLVFRVRAFVY